MQTTNRRNLIKSAAAAMIAPAAALANRSAFAHAGTQLTSEEADVLADILHGTEGYAAPFEHRWMIADAICYRLASRRYPDDADTPKLLKYQRQLRCERYAHVDGFDPRPIALSRDRCNQCGELLVPESNPPEIRDLQIGGPSVQVVCTNPKCENSGSERVIWRTAGHYANHFPEVAARVAALSTSIA